VRLPPLVEAVVRRLVRAFSPEQIVLFGSWAQGRARSQSDVDLLVVARTGGDASSAQRRARQLVGSCFPPVDVVVADPADVVSAETARSPFLASIIASGVAIYESGGSSSERLVDGSGHVSRP
jgi:predicted nucleotidyltransferase